MIVLPNHCPSPTFVSSNPAGPDPSFRTTRWSRPFAPGSSSACARLRFAEPLTRLFPFRSYLRRLDCVMWDAQIVKNLCSNSLNRVYFGLSLWRA